MSDTYVLLTGSKNNAGDYLIKWRAKEILGRLRPDRALLDFDAWKPLSDSQLDEVNSSRAVLLTGGPSLQKAMYPRVYALRDRLDDIRVPILSMGIGWKSARGRWEDTRSYPLSEDSRRLLKRIDQSGYLSSVRDYHTLNTLQAYGYDNFVMTGCPALYSFEHLERKWIPPRNIGRISLSVGVLFATSKSLRNQLESLITGLRESFPHAVLTAVFHHSLDESYLHTPHPNRALWKAQRELTGWLRREGIPFVDVSGGVEKLLDHYSDSDLHAGYRVHAHILMSSLSKPSILINEDGRGSALQQVLGGLSFDFGRHRFGRYSARVGSLAKGAMDVYEASHGMSEDLIRNLRYELCNGYPRLAGIRPSIDRHFERMTAFVSQLP